MEDKPLVSSLSTICREHDFYRSAVDFPYQPVRGPRQFSNELCRPVFYRVADLSGCAPSCVRLLIESRDHRDLFEADLENSRHP